MPTATIWRAKRVMLALLQPLLQSSVKLMPALLRVMTGERYLNDSHAKYIPVHCRQGLGRLLLDVIVHPNMEP